MLFIIGGDFNAHHLLWDPSHLDQRGECIVHSINQHSLNIVSPTDSTFIAPTGQSIIDFFIVSPNLLYNNSFNHDIFHKIDLFTSHHRPINLTCNTISSPVFNSFTDWKTFGNILSNIHFPPCFNLNYLQPSLNLPFIDNCIDFFTQTILLAHNSSSHFVHSSRPIKKIWWTEELTALKNKCLFQKQSFSTQYKNSHKLYKKKIYEAKHFHFKKFTSNLHNNPDTVFKFIKSHNKPTVISPSTLLEHFFPINGFNSTTSSPNLPLSHDYSTFNFFTPETIFNLISALPKNKSPGPDKINKNHLLNMPFNFLCLFTYIINSCIQSHYFPVPWKRAKVIFIDKGKNSTNPSPGDYRPISLLSICGKLLEKVILFELENHIKPSEFQFGFSKGKTTSHALFRITDFIKNRPSKLACITIAFDFTKAFDTLNHKSIISALQQQEIPTHITSLISSFLNNRSVTYNNLHSYIKSGVPQGAVLSPTLFNITIKSILDQLSLDYHITAYADDLTLQFNSVPCKHIINDELIAIVSKLNSLAAPLNLSLSAPKSQAIISYPRIIVVDNPPIQVKSDIKILGLTIDKSLSYIKHFLNIKNKCYSSYFLISKIAKLKYGITSNLRRLLFNTIIVPKLSYGIIITFKSLGSSKNKKTLNSIHRSFASLIIKSFKSASYNMVVPLSKTSTLSHYLTKAYNNFIIKFPHFSLSPELVPPPFIPYSNIHPRLKYIYNSIESIQSLFPNNPSSIFSQSITLHCNLKYYLFKIKVSTSPFCPFCPNRHDTITHLIFYCSHYNKLRNHIFHEFLSSWPSKSVYLHPHLLTLYLKLTNRL